MIALNMTHSMRGTYLLELGVKTTRSINSSLLNNVFQKVKKCLIEKNLTGFKLSENSFSVQDIQKKLIIYKIVNNIFGNYNIEVSLD